MEALRELPGRHRRPDDRLLAAQIRQAGIRTQYTHAVDIAPTIYELLGIELPEVVNGFTQHPLEGESFAASLHDADAKGKQTQFYSMLGTRGDLPRRLEGSVGDAGRSERLGRLRQAALGALQRRGRSERVPRPRRGAAREAEGARRALVGRGGQYDALPLESRDAIGILLAPAAAALQAARPVRLLPRTAPRCRSRSTPNIRNRSYAIAVELKIDSPEASGVLFAQGARFGGHALYLKDGKFKYVYNWVGEFEQIVESTKPIPTGEHVLSVVLRKEGDGMPTEGTLSLYLDDEKVGEAKIKTQPGQVLARRRGAQRRQGRRRAGDRRLSRRLALGLPGGTIHQATVDVAGEPWVDLEKELAGAFARD